MNKFGSGPQHNQQSNHQCMIFEGRNLNVMFNWDSGSTDKDLLIVLLYLYDYLKTMFGSSNLDIREINSNLSIGLDELAVTKKRKMRVIPRDFFPHQLKQPSVNEVRREITLHLKNNKSLLQREQRFGSKIDSDIPIEEKQGVVTENINKTGYAKIVQLIKMPMPTMVSQVLRDDSNQDEDDYSSSDQIGETLKKGIKNMNTSKTMIKMSEVEKHSKVDDCWTVVGEYVYDITPIVKSHPGGFTKIFQAAGNNGTKFFSEGHFAIDSRYFLGKFEIGQVDFSS